MQVIRFVAAAAIGLALSSVAGAFGAPTGRLLFMLWDRASGDAHFYVVNATGTGRREVAVFRATVPPLLSLSPDGTRFAYLCARGLCVRAMDADTVRVVARSARGAKVHGFAWSPDSSRFAFVRGAALWGVAAGGGRERRLARLPGPEFTLSWSPRGSYLALTRRRMFRPVPYVWTEVYVARADGSGLRRLAAAMDISHAAPSLSHDERLLAYSTGEVRNHKSVTGRTHVVDVRTGRRVRLVRGNDPSYSPVDGRLLVTRYDADQDAVLFVVDPRGRQRRLHAPPYDPTWSPDGREIADSVERRLVATDVRTGRRRTITGLRATGEYGFSLEWARGG